MLRKLLLLFLLIGFAISAKAQLSDLHYLPPLKQGQNNAGIRQQAVYLSTPEPTAFTVNVYRGTNNTPIDTFTISNVNPEVFTMSNGDNNIILVNNANTGIVLNNSGLRFEAPSGNRFYVNYRGSSNAQSASLTSKGRQAMGTNFKWGGVPNRGQHPSKSNTLGIMATEDNTTINLFGYDPGCEFRVGNDRAGITANTHQIILDANESFVYETYIGNSPTQAHEDGWIGASIVSDKDIVISNGSMNFGRQVGATNRDAGIDQPVPENRLGKEYVFVRGNGNTNGWTEFPLLIATADNTQIFVNGAATPIATINNGDYFEVPSNMYSSNTVGANMLVQTSKDVYAYQCMAGASTPYTQGLNFVAPVNCLLPDVMDNIPDIRNMAGTAVSGGLTIIAAVNTPDSNITVTDGNGPVSLPASNAVAGSSDWKTFFIPNLNGNVNVQSTGPMAVGFFGYNGARGVAGYFSGFDTVPEVSLEIRGGAGCFVGSEIYEATSSNFDAFQWYKDGVMIPGANSPVYIPNGAGEYFLRGTKGPCTYDSNPILGLYCDPDIHIEKTVDRAEIIEGETATFTIRVQNWGVGPLTNLQITDNIPTGLSLVNAFTITGNWSGSTWNIGTLDGGEVAELELEVQADAIDTLPLLSLTNTVTHTQDQTDTNLTEDTTSANIVVHNDYDNDGVIDIVDQDDDNDGIYDVDECSGLAFNINSGTTHNSNLMSVDNYLILDIFSLDNSFNLQLNGADLAGEIQFQNSPGNFARFLDGSGYGESGNPQIYTLTGTHGSPLIRVVVNQLGEFSLFGSRTSNGPLEPMTLATPANAFTWNGGGSNTIAIGQSVAGPTNMQGELLTAGCDTDANGIPDHLDLDSDGDGCSDANEFYKEENADGGDGGEYGTGVPVVDANDGTVDIASYLRVFAPEILLGNTSEDLGGNDINGQALSLGQTFEYVLRFQNTGDDNATGYTIRDVLPSNLTLDNINVTNAPGSTHNYDINTNILTIDVPDNLVEVGDPEYSIRIRVTLASNCSDFVSACSSQLQNYAYSTYSGVINTNVFSDENGSNSITACPRTPEVAENSILNDLANCNEARTVQLCGDDVILTAGEGFTTYNWFLDTNGNGQIDAGDSAMNDGDPDTNPRTLLVTNIGTYIVEKISNGTCPDLIEIMEVERFGTTQTNPIVEYFNQVNGDANPDNDLQGEIVSCSIDGEILPNIFLCGTNDEATIQLGITDAQSIVWQKLDEGSCSDAAADCANKNGTCTWSNVSTLDNYTITDEGEYRIVINYQNGCFSRFYFNVFKNNLEILTTTEDILCTTPGNIRVTNIGAGYGFQLINAIDDSIIVPYSANNGPSFTIANNGTYRVQVTALNPADNTPIVGSCIFETEDIGIQELIFDATVDSSPADCNNLGTVSIAALNARPNYSYELFLDDGSNGGQGSLVSSQTAVNDNTHTFLNLTPNDYILITSTQDGCSNTSNITVASIDELTLSAITSENISCNPGVVNLTPAGGLPSPEYEMAIWSIDGVLQYADEASVPDSAYQTETTFLFGDAGNPNRDGDYIFILRDGNGCYGLSNSVSVEDLGNLSISASNANIVCADTSTATMSITVTGGTPPYQYSLDGGTNYQNANTFTNLAAGHYTITVMDSSGNLGTRCIEDFDYEIVQPFRLTASAAIIEDASCNPAGALVKIINATGGQMPYEYSFNGGTFSGVDEQNLLPGTHNFALRDALGCTYNMELTVPTTTIDPTFSNSVDYNCIGEGAITITPSNTTDFTYSYSLNGAANAPADNNVFNNVADGTHTITIGYSNITSPDQSTVFFENFGTGPNTQIAEIGTDYCYEPQDGSTVSCNRGPAGILVNGEYTVTNLVTNPISSLTSPQDHSGLIDGRFLAIDISTFSDTGNEVLNSILWRRQNIQVSANREVTLGFWAYNLKNTTGTGNNPEVLVEIFDNLGTLIHSEVAPEIPKNNNNTDWHERTISFNPGASTEIDIVFRSNVNSNDGNDLILDDISVSQLLEACEKTADITVVVEDNKEFSVNVLGTTDPSCNTGADGSVRFEVLNFPATGFRYSSDGLNWTTSLVSEVTTATSFGAGTHTIQIESLPLATPSSCTTDFAFTLTDPSPIVPSLSQTAAYTCFNTGGTLEATATGGTPGYSYRLEDTLGNEIRPFQTDATFTNVTEGDYLVRIRDAKGCEEITATAVTIARYEDIDFDLTVPTGCYDGLNNASITATVNTGNGNYTFRLNVNGVNGPWITPSPSTASTHTFNGLSDGSYSVEVSDQYGCTSTIETVTITPILTAEIFPVDVTACADGSIAVNATGGDGNYAYAYLPTGTTVLDSHFSSSNAFTVSSGSEGDYDVYVRDNGGIAPRCEFMRTVSVDTAPVLAYNAIPTDALCFGGTGSIAVTITSGSAPYTYQLVDTDHGTSNQTQTGVVNTSRTYFNLTPGDYEVVVTDANGCALTQSAITVSQPDELTATVTGITPANCTGNINDFGFGFSAYPTTLGTIQFSADGGLTWIGDNSAPGTSDQLTGYLSGDTVNPSMRTVDGSNNTICQTDLPPFIIPYPLDDLDISLTTIIVNCDELRVKVQGSEGSAPYEYSFAEDPANFDPNTATWIPGGNIDILNNAVPAGEGMYEWLNLVPGRTYVFYVRDSSGPPACVRQSTVNVNDITTNPMEISASYEPSCNAANNGEITYTITDTDGSTEPQMDWTLYDINDVVIQASGIVPYASTINISGLAANEYYIVVSQVDGSNTSQCISASENLILEELDAITATLNPVQDISCEAPGLILVENIQGGGGTFTYTVTGPAPFVTQTSTPDNPIEIPVNSPAGDYHVTITDQFGCSSAVLTTSLTLSENPTITSLNVDNCAATTTVTIQGSSPAFPALLFSIDGGTTYFDNAGIFNNIIPGAYTAVVKNGAGCTVSQAFTVEPSIQATAVLTDDLGCGPGQEAAIRIEVSAGSGNYEYEILDSSTADVVARQTLVGTSVTQLITLADTYTINVYDMTSNPVCPRTFSIEVLSAIAPNFSYQTTDVNCFGNTNGSIALTQVNNGNNPLTYSLSPNNGTFNATTSTYENLPPDTYQITGTGPNGCSTVLSNVVINEPLDITFDLPTVNAFQCSSGNSQNNATISINTSSIAGGSNNFSIFEFEEATSGNIQNGTSSSYNFTDIAGGDVIVRVFDSAGCMAQQIVTVPAFDQLNSASVSILNPISCTSSGEDISIDVSSSITNFGANPTNYEFRLLPATVYQAPGNSTFNNLAPGAYTFGVRNISTGCELTVNHSVEDPNTFSLNVQKIADVTCFGDDGQIQLNITDATYTGNYSWTIYDPQGTPTDRLDDTMVMSMPLGNDPRAPFDVPAGDYIVEVTQDAFPECSQFRAFTISAPDADITIATIDLVDVGCSNDRGSAHIIPVGGVAPYDITLTNLTTTTVYPIVASVNAHLFQGLNAGQYSLEVTDALGCTRSFPNTFTLDPTDPIAGTLSATSLACEGDNDARVEFVLTTVPPRNVTPVYSYTLNKYSDAAKTTLLSFSAVQASPVFDNQGSGFYTILVEDNLGCSYEDAVPVEIVNPIEVEGVLLLTQALSCTADAELELSVTGGTGPYFWSTDGVNFNAMNGINGPNTHLFQNVTPGSYHYFVQDNLNCDARFPTNEIVINTIETLTVDPVNPNIIPAINCNGEATAVIDWVADGGLGNYQYGLFRDLAHTDEVRPYQSTGTFENIPEGTYYIHVQSEDCEVVSSVIEITEPEALVVRPEITNISCFGDEDGRIEIDVEFGTAPYQFSISPNLNKFVNENSFENLATGDYSVIVQDAKGCIELIEFSITEPDQLLMTLSATPEICVGDQDGAIIISPQGGTPPYSSAINSNDDVDFVEGRLNINDLAGGDYFIYVKDANGCTVQDLIRVETGANLNASVEVIYECSGTTPTNRLNLTFEDNSVEEDVIYALNSTNPNDFILDPNFENLLPGNHFIQIVHANGCSTTVDFEIEEFETLVLTLEQLDLNEITATATGGREGYTYYFDGQNNTDDNTFYIRRTDTFEVRVVDENGCEATASIFVEFIDIEIPNFFTPDGDGKNDIWIPRNIEQFPDIFITIYDRYGREVYRIKDNEDGWNGLYQEADLPTGDYWYVIRLNGEDDDREFVGNFTLYR
ncbi:MAG: T9SS type B sorting domain-containing protein [Maribacter sp.]|uniref:T9SS type B sorting domain-containing protein n=1 Tax=Maribacter sp. TaxID=1897614 RepID=UPI0032989261